MAAATKVFDTIELLEMILYKLSTRDLLFAQQINKTFKAVIDSSIKLQQALFFQPVPGDPVPFTRSPTIYERLSHEDTKKARELNKRKCLKNPLLYDLVCSLRSECDGEKVYPGDVLSRNGFRDYDSSWTRMLPTQPPLQDCFYVTCHYRDRKYGDHHRKDVFPTDKFHMPEILHVLDGKIEKYLRRPNSYIVFQWAAPWEYGKYLEDNQQLEDLIISRKQEKVDGSEDSTIRGTKEERSNCS